MNNGEIEWGEGERNEDENYDHCRWGCLPNIYTYNKRGLGHKLYKSNNRKTKSSDM